MIFQYTICQWHFGRHTLFIKRFFVRQFGYVCEDVMKSVFAQENHQFPHVFTVTFPLYSSFTLRLYVCSIVILGFVSFPSDNRDEDKARTKEKECAKREEPIEMRKLMGGNSTSQLMY